MKEDFIYLLQKACLFILGAILTIAAIGVLNLDINFFVSESSEKSLTEASQILLLLAIIAIYAHISCKRPLLRPALILVIGFFFCMLLRELDFWFGLIGFHWLPPVMLTAGLAIAYALRHGQNSLHGLASFAASQSFYLTISGLLTLFVFSRLFGMGSLWEGLLGAGYPRWVKIYAEEGVELFGYLLCFLGALFYKFELSSKQLP